MVTKTMLRFLVPLSAFFPSFFIGVQPYTAVASSPRFDPPALYLTWQNDPTTTMVIRWHSIHQDKRTDSVHYRRRGESCWKTERGVNHAMAHSKRIVHVVELKALSPGTVYQFRLGEDCEIYHFRTMPDSLTEEVRFVVGGDTYGRVRRWRPKDWLRGDRHYYELLRKTNLRASRTSPMFVVIGGDFTYSDGHPKRAERWFRWLRAWKQDMVTCDSLLIPLVPAIGNHETLKNRYKKDWNKPNQPYYRAEQAPYFYSLFIAPDSLSYRALDFGDYMSLILLDSGHTNYIQEQSEWLKSALRQRNNVHFRFATYHVPAYPSYRDTMDEISKSIRKCWAPLFERYQLDVAFEHHDHMYKRTHPIRRESVNPNGVVYLGDGAWGKLRRKKLSRWYLARSESRHHFIAVTLDRDKALFQAVDSDGDIFDEYTLSLVPN